MDQKHKCSQTGEERVFTTQGSMEVRRRTRIKRAGFSLIELTISIVVMGILCSIGIPRFQQSLEQSRADVAGANLRAVWSAQRLYWLQNRTYAPDLSTLLSANLIDPSLTTATAPYTYSVSGASDSDFTATATRSSCPSWSGSFSITSDGAFSGSVSETGGGVSIVPGFQ